MSKSPQQKQLRVHRQVLKLRRMPYQQQMLGESREEDGTERNLEGRNGRILRSLKSKQSEKDEAEDEHLDWEDS